MTIEERVSKLEQDNQELKERVGMLSKREEFATPSELADLLRCSKNHIYIQIRSGAIQAVTVGTAIRIPMSQFHPKANPNRYGELSNCRLNHPMKNVPYRRFATSFLSRKTNAILAGQGGLC